MSPQPQAVETVDACPCGQPIDDGDTRCGSCEAERQAELADNARQRMREGL